MSLPETVEGLSVETWAMERYLSHWPEWENGHRIMRALSNGRSGVDAAKEAVQGGYAPPGVRSPTVMWDDGGIRVMADRGWDTPPALVISWERVVDYVRRQYGEQQTLF